VNHRVTQKSKINNSRIKFIVFLIGITSIGGLILIISEVDALGDEIVPNLGFIGSNADGTYLNNGLPLDIWRNSSSILGQAVRINETTSVEFGSDANKGQWDFLHDPTKSNQTSVSLWGKGDFDGESIYPILYTGDQTDGFLIHAFFNTLSLGIVENDNSIILPDDSGLSIPDDGNFHMFTVLVDKNNETSTVKLCVDGASNCTTVDRVNTWTGIPSLSDHVLSLGNNFCDAQSCIAFYWQADDLAIWKDYILTSTDINNLYNSGTGSPAGSSGANIQPANLVAYYTFDEALGNIDTDGDGIFDEIDTLPNTFSNNFSDTGIGGSTFGNITSRGNQTLMVTEEPNPDGVRIKADISGGLTPATISVCGGVSKLNIEPGDEIIITCSSVTITVINGQIETTFIATNGTEGTTTLTQTNTITFDPNTFSFTTPITNNLTVMISVNGEIFLVEPGASILIPLQSARPDSDPTVRWVNGIGDEPCTDLNTFNCVDEVTRNDNDYIQTIGLGKKNSDKQFYTLSDITDPLTSEGHILRYTISEADVGVNPVKLDVVLRQGQTIIATFHHENLPTGFILVEQTLTAAQANSITDYSDLELTLDGNCDKSCQNSPGNREKIRISWIEFAIMASP
jgi:hypothetical protein